MNDDFYRKDERVSEEQEMLAVAKDNPDLFKQFMAALQSNPDLVNVLLRQAAQQASA